ncbi:hypothetical protein LWI29_003862 [Acer saccharum]|uniref:Uncharacterized protein n=3 Tax=Acereae TaxID=1977919 RepID=A0AA39RQK3_ACESA|nr:hypothetical protein LWI29_003862 [Acer saccharum]
MLYLCTWSTLGVANFHPSIHRNTRYMNNKILRIFVSLLLKKGSCLTLMLDNIFCFGKRGHWSVKFLSSKTLTESFSLKSEAASTYLQFRILGSSLVPVKMSNIVLFEDIFVVDKIDPDGKKFDKVSRIEARSQNCDMYMLLDVNTEVYRMRIGDKFTMALAHTLNLDGTPDTGYYTPGGRKSLADKYEYVMHGKLYKISDEGSGKHLKAEIYVSYGGLLMMLKGDPSYITQFELDQKLFLLMRKL